MSCPPTLSCATIVALDYSDSQFRELSRVPFGKRALLAYPGLNQKNDFTILHLNQQFNPWGRVGEQAQIGGYVVFSHICRPAWSGLCEVIVRCH